MSDAARLSRQVFSRKPPATPYSTFSPTPGEITAIQGCVKDAVVESSFAAIVSYAEAISGLRQGSISWSIVRLYYTCFYSLRALFLISNTVPFNCGKEMMLDLQAGKFLKGGRSTHDWNWSIIKKIPQLGGSWYLSKDSEDAYNRMRKNRENVNYTHAFTDPIFHNCLSSGEKDVVKRFRSYRDDDAFLYTYLPDHLAIAYPTGVHPV